MGVEAQYDTLVTYFQTTMEPVVCAYLFGSRARSEAGTGSDVDVAVLFPESAGKGLLSPANAIRGDLERLLGREVDLIDLRRAPVDLIHRVLRDSRLLVERNPRERVQFEVRARNDYFDLLPHLNRYRREQAA